MNRSDASITTPYKIVTVFLAIITLIVFILFIAVIAIIVQNSHHLSENKIVNNITEALTEIETSALNSMFTVVNLHLLSARRSQIDILDFVTQQYKDTVVEIPYDQCNAINVDVQSALPPLIRYENKAVAVPYELVTSAAWQTREAS